MAFPTDLRNGGVDFDPKYHTANTLVHGSPLVAALTILPL